MVYKDDIPYVVPVFYVGLMSTVLLLLRPPELKGTLSTYRWLWAINLLCIALTGFLCVMLADSKMYDALHVIMVSLSALVASILTATGTVRLRRARARRSEVRLKR